MNPYVVVGSPNYAAPLLNFGALSGQQNQQQNGQQGQQGQQKSGQQQNPYQAFSAAIGNFGRGLYNYLNPQQQQVPGMPMNIAPMGAGADPSALGGSAAGANTMLAGLY